MEEDGSEDGINLVIFDVEGVIIPKRRFLFQEAIRWLKTQEVFEVIFFGFLYEIGVISIEYALKRIYKLFQGVNFEEFFKDFKEIPTIPGAFQVFQTLKQRGYQTALLSTGIPKLFVENLAKRIGANYAIGLELETVNGQITGKIGGDVIEHNGKAIILKNLLKVHNLFPQNCVIVADDRNNIPMLSLCNKSIGFSPDFFFAAKADYTINGNLSEILEFLEPNFGRVKPATINRSELFREAIHMGCFLISVISNYSEINVRIFIIFITIISIVYITSEFARIKNIKFPVFSTITLRAAIGEEEWSFATAPIFFAIGITIPLLIYPPPVGYVSIAVLTLGDGAASVFGKRFGRITLPFNKSKKLEGTLIGFIFALIGSLFFIDPSRALLAAAIGMFIESIPSPINDNISVPILSGLAILISL